MAQEPVRLAIIGMGGFAGDHHRAALALEKQGVCQVVCACDPRPEAFAEAQRQWEFAERGVAVYTDYRAMLDAHAAELELVTIPTPIPLHAPMHRAVLERNLGCYLEKPPTLDYAELEAMLALDATAAKRTMVGFNFIIEPMRHAMKRRILSGEFGAVRRAGYLGMAPRATSYFTRSNWAGRLMMDGGLVLDSCMGNALSHYLHNLLFWAGERDLLHWAEVAGAEAEVYRAHAIENLDTLFLRGTCANGAEILVAATHACDGAHINLEWIECEEATIRHRTWQPYEIEWRDGRVETVAPAESSYGGLLEANFRYYRDYLRDQQPRPLTRLEDTRPFVTLYDLALIAAQRITPFPESLLVRSSAGEGKGEFVAVPGIQAVCEAFLSSGRFPSQQGVAWAQPGGRAALSDLPRLREVIAGWRRSDATP